MRTKSITVTEIEYVAFSFAQKLMNWDEPIPDFGTRFPNILESCIKTPFFRFEEKDQYRGLVGKASIFFYLMIKNHPFQNGNKRIAVMSLFYLLHKNGKWLDISNVDLYNFAVGIASSKPASKDHIMEQIAFTIQKHLINSEEITS
jgi:death-on-curing family protein